MNDTRYGCKFSVIAVPDRADMFLMNMRVYDFVPKTTPSTSDTNPVSVIWCAVYNIAQLERSN